MATDSILEVLPEGNPQLAASLFETGKGIPTPSSCLTTGAATDFGFSDKFSDVLLTLRCCGVANPVSPKLLAVQLFVS